MNSQIKKILTAVIVLGLLLGLLYVSLRSPKQATVSLENITASSSTISAISKTYSPGVYTVDLPNIPSTAEGINLVLTRENWPDGKVADVKVVGQGNVPGGETQTFNMGPMELDGGVLLNAKTNAVSTTSTWSWSWPGQAEKDADGKYVLDANGNTIRQEIKISDVKLELDVLQPITTNVTLTAF